MPTFLLWNVQRKPLDTLVLGLVDRYAVDAVLLIEHDCSLIVPRVGYQALLFRAISGVAPFPAKIVFPNGQVAANIQNETTLREVLKRYFHSDEVRDTVQNLLSTFAALPEPTE